MQSDMFVDHEKNKYRQRQVRLFDGNHKDDVSAVCTREPGVFSCSSMMGKLSLR